MKSLWQIFFFLAFISAPAVQAHNKVVVVPLLENAPNIDRVITVAPSGSDFSSLEAAVNSLPASTPNSRGDYLIVVAPGFYIIETQLVLPKGTHLTGSGTAVTTISGAIGSNEQDRHAALIVMEDKSQISNLSVNNMGAENAGHSAAIYSLSASNSRIENVGVRVKGGVSGAVGIHVDGPSGFNFKVSNIDINITAPGLFGRGILVENNANLFIDGLDLFIANGSAGNNYGIYAVGANRVQLKNSILHTTHPDLPGRTKTSIPVVNANSEMFTVDSSELYGQTHYASSLLTSLRIRHSIVGVAPPFDNSSVAPMLSNPTSGGNLVKCTSVYHINSVNVGSDCRSRP